MLTLQPNYKSLVKNSVNNNTVRMGIVMALTAMIVATPSLSGATNTPTVNNVVESYQSNKKRMGVPAFETGSINKDYGIRMADLLITELMQNRNYDLIERSQLNKVMEEQGLGASGIVDQSNVAQVGKVAGLDYIVLGSLTEASVTDKDNSWRDKNGRNNPSFSTVVKVAVTIKVIEVETGKIVLSTNGANNETFSWGDRPQRATLDNVLSVAKTAIKKAAFKVIDTIAPNEINVLLATKDGKKFTEVTISQGREDGVREGARYVVVREGEVLTDLEGNVIDVQRIEIAYLTIKTVNAKTAVAKVEKVFTDPKTKNQYEIIRGDLVKMQDETQNRTAGEKLGGLFKSLTQ